MKKLHITASDEACAQLEELRDSGDFNTIADMVRFSLKLNKFIQKQLRDDNIEVILRNEYTGEEQEILVLK